MKDYYKKLKKKQKLWILNLNWAELMDRKLPI